MSRRSHVVRVALALIGLALIAPACGVSRDGSPQAIRDQLPPDLVEGQSTESDTVVNPALNVQIWMVGDGDLLTTVGRSIEHTPEAVMKSLLLGTTPTERADGITSAITRETQGEVSLQEADKIAVVNLVEGSLNSTSSERKLAFGQIVYSLTGLTTVDSVVFSIAGEFISVLTDDGATVAGQAVTRRNFESFNRTSINFGAANDNDDDDVQVVPVAAPTPTPTVSADVDDVARTDVSLWMVDQNDVLIRVVRRIELKEEAVLASLLLGPEIAERAIGIRSAIPLDALAINIDVNETPGDEFEGTAFVDLAAGSLPGASSADDERLLAVGQIVYSLTGMFTIDQVIISIGGEQEPMLTERGVAPAGQPLGRSEFASYAPVARPVATPGVEPTPASAADATESTDTAEG